MSEADHYRLKPVHDQRSRDERVRRGDLAAAVGDARATEAQVAAAAERVAAARAALATARTTPPGATANAIALRDRYIVKRRGELDVAIDVHLRATAAHRGQLGAVDSARGRLAIARAEREVIERHFARWRTERRKLAERRED